MKIDLTVQISKEMWNNLWNDGIANKKMTGFGHLGTHFDVMNREFSLENTNRNGKIFDVSHIQNREIEIQDINTSNINANDFVIFHTGCLEKMGYGENDYFKSYTELSVELIRFLVSKQVSMIGIDAAGIRNPSEHVKMDQECADHGVFVIENLANLHVLLEEKGDQKFSVHTFPMNVEGLTGLPCRVVAEF